MGSPPRVELAGVWRRFGGTWAVSDLSFTLLPGTVTGLLGPNGAGKTTSIRLMLGLIRPSRGEVRLDGSRLTGGPDTLGVALGALVERPSFFGTLTAFENLLHLGGLRWPVDAVGVDEALALVGLSGARDRRVAGFSTGMLQRLGLALAFLHRPALLVLDEPTAGLDPEFGITVRQLLSRVRASRDATVLVSSHLLSEVEAVCDRIVLLAEGRRVLEGTLDELLAGLGPARFVVQAEPSGSLERAVREAVPQAGVEPLSDGVRLALSRESVPGLVAHLVHGGFAVREVREERPRLEDLYMQAMARGRPRSAGEEGRP